MKKIVLIIIFSYTFISAFCQSFIFRDSAEHNINAGKLIKLANNKILINNYDYDSITYSRNTQLFLLNIDGKILKQKSYNNIINEIVEIAEDSILLISVDSVEGGTKLKSTIINNEFEILISDSTILTSDSTMLNYPFFEKIRLVKKDDRIFFYSIFYKTNTTKFTVIGEILRNGKFKEDQHSFEYQSPFLFDMIIDDDYNFYLFYFLGKILVLDTNFNIINEHSFEFHDFIAGYDAIWDTSGNIVIGGATIQNQLAVVKTDKYLKEINRHEIISAYSKNKPGEYTSMVKTNDGFNFISTKNYCTDNYPYINCNSFIYVLKMDNNFDVVWEKEFGGDAFYFVLSVLQTNENGCYILASRYKHDIYPEERELVLLKIKSNGVISSTQIKIDNNYNSLSKVYPNPGHNYFNIKTEFEGELTVQIYSVIGNLVYTGVLKNKQIRISTNNLATGIYSYKLLSNNKILGQGKWVKN